MAEFEELRLTVTLIDDASAGLVTLRQHLRELGGPQTNAQLEGAALNSQHMRAMALDIHIPEVDNEAVARDFKTFNDVYCQHVAAIGPTRTPVEVGALPTPIAVELKVIAWLGDR